MKAESRSPSLLAGVLVAALMIVVCVPAVAVAAAAPGASPDTALSFTPPCTLYAPFFDPPPWRSAWVEKIG
jgi:hypothetical protein